MDRLVITLLVLTTFSCGSQGIDKKELKNRLMIRSNDKIIGNDYDSALYYVNEAIKIDTNFYLGHYQKLIILSNLERNDEALLTAKKISRLRNFNNMSLEGMVYERLGNLGKAKELYKTTMDNWPKADLDSNYQSRLEYLQLGTVVYGKEFGLQEISKIDTLKLNDGEIEIIETMRRTIEKYEGDSYRELMENINVLPGKHGQ